MKNEFHRDTWIEVDLDAIQYNISQLAGQLKQDTVIMAVVKANAYGHGYLEVAEAALEAGAEWLAVAFLDEALFLRKHGFTAPILVLGAARPDDAGLAAAHGIRLTVFSADWIRSAREFLEADVLHIHLKIDTGMGRLGFTDQNGLADAEAFASDDSLINIEGAFTHFATADEPDRTYADQQHERFLEFLDVFQQKPPMIHASNSAGAFLRDNSAFNAVRFGISMYGLVPSGDIRHEMPAPLKPALSMYTKMVQVKKLKQGEKVSYGATYTAGQDEWIATLPIGYADGWIRQMQGFEVLAGEHRAEIIGRVCMDQCMIRLPFEMQEGSVVTLVGEVLNDRILLDDIAAHNGTIHYESACLLTARVPRMYRKNGVIKKVFNHLN
ncbi:alanine racemase [Jeotgalibacillus haloalkalitolerans]|uniref:Alanine racemase n=1 Tax=Jeotgalibacillus haloalkalitolerans TaxID=3104292 RepID=A0ABU5KPH3_9BACL|nr:alanine racemase [Jeotgalibacillus sp. HH7-29]MDZ5713153.1 alanine racemase [Jeotgalibacillus sp. HH7-29]